MRNKFTALLLTAALLLLPGCTLAREDPEEDGGEGAFTGDRFIGVYVVREEPGAQIDRTHWVEYSTLEAVTEQGQTISLPGEILIGEYDEEAEKFVFPGLDGLGLFVVTGQTERGEPFSLCYNELYGGSFHHIAADAGESYEMEATLYYGAPLDDPDYDPWADSRVWHHYHVYQMADGTVYLDGTGDSHGGGTGMALTQTETRTVTVDGEKTEVYTTTKVGVEYIQRLVSVTVRQYSAQGDKLTDLIFDPAEGVPAVTWHADAAWAVVEEVSADGTAVRTAYDRPADAAELSHSLILLDAGGMGYGAALEFE